MNPARPLSPRGDDEASLDTLSDILSDNGKALTYPGLEIAADIFRTNRVHDCTLLFVFL